MIMLKIFWQNNINEENRFRPIMKEESVEPYHVN